MKPYSTLQRLANPILFSGAAMKHAWNQWSRSRRIKRAIALIALTLLIILYPTVIEPNWVQVVSSDLTLPHLSPEFENYRVVHLTDIHADDWMTPKRLRSLVRRVNKLEPDAVVFNGRFCNDSARIIPRNIAGVKPTHSQKMLRLPSSGIMITGLILKSFVKS